MTEIWQEYDKDMTEIWQEYDRSMTGVWKSIHTIIFSKNDDIFSIFWNFLHYDDIFSIPVLDYSSALETVLRSQRNYGP